MSSRRNRLSSTHSRKLCSPILVLNSDELNASGSGNNSNSNSKLGMHIKSEDPATDPLAGVDGSFGPMGQGNPSGPNRSGMSQSSPDRIQPLPSNVVNKQSNSMDVSSQLLLFPPHFIDRSNRFSTCNSKVRFLSSQRNSPTRAPRRFAVDSFQR